MQTQKPLLCSVIKSPTQNGKCQCHRHHCSIPECIFQRPAHYKPSVSLDFVDVVAQADRQQGSSTAPCREVWKCDVVWVRFNLHRLIRRLLSTCCVRFFRRALCIVRCGRRSLQLCYFQFPFYLGLYEPARRICRFVIASPCVLGTA